MQMRHMCCYQPFTSYRGNEFRLPSMLENSACQLLGGPLPLGHPGRIPCSLPTCKRRIPIFSTQACCHVCDVLLFQHMLEKKPSCELELDNLPQSDPAAGDASTPEPPAKILKPSHYKLSGMASLLASGVKLLPCSAPAEPVPSRER